MTPYERDLAELRNLEAVAASYPMDEKWQALDDEPQLFGCLSAELAVRRDRGETFEDAVAAEHERLRLPVETGGRVLRILEGGET